MTMYTSSKAMGYETKRLHLTLAHPALAKAVAAYYQRNREFLRPFEPARDEAFFTERAQRRYLAQEAKLARRDQCYRFYLSRKERPTQIIGMAALNAVVRGAFQSSFVGYKLDWRFVNQGYMTEALLKLVDIAFDDLLLHRLEASIMPRNVPSLRAAEKAGFRYEGLSPHYLQVDGVWEDHIHMVRLNEGDRL